VSLILAISAFLTTAAGVYLLMDRSYFRVVLGVGFIGHATNLIVIAAGRWKPEPPIVDLSVPAARMADPLPHALLLTAIVISMAVGLYLLALIVANLRFTGQVSVEPAPESDDGAGAEEIAGELSGQGLEQARKGITP